MKIMADDFGRGVETLLELLPGDLALGQRRQKVAAAPTAAPSVGVNLPP
jgi:hypothetical protein